MKTITVFFVVAVFFAVAIATPPPRYPAKVKNISGPVVITKPGSYILVDDIFITEYAAITIAANNVVINGNRHEVFGFNAIYSSGNYTGLELKNIVLKSQTTHEPTLFLEGVKDVKIDSCDIGGSYFYMRGVTNVDIKNSNFYNTTTYYDVHIIEAVGMSLYKNKYYGSSRGFYFEKVSHSNFSDLKGEDIIFTQSKDVKLNNSVSGFIHIELSDSVYGGNNNFSREYIYRSTNINLGNIGTAVEGIEATSPTSFALRQNYPNPFNPSTSISYSLAKLGNVNLTVYDLLGNEVAQLVNEVQPAGKHTIQFDGSKLASGVYFYRLDTGSGLLTRKMMLLK